MRLFFGLFIILRLLLSTALAVPTVTAVTESSTDQIANQNVRELLGNSGRSPVDLSLHPELRPTLMRIQNLLLRNLQAEADSNHYNLVLVDDMSINAGFIKHRDGERTIVLNLGLLHFVPTDDELAFVLGHEFNHGRSQLDRHAEDQPDLALAKALKRSVENEVDARSLIRWLHERGYNPHAALHFMQRLTDRYGSGLSTTHTSTDSRWDVLNLGIVALARGGGQAVKPDQPSQYSHEVLGPLHDQYLHHPSQEFATQQLTRARSLLESLPADPKLQTIDASYQAVAQGTQADPENYSAIYGHFWERIQSLIGDDLVAPEERVELELELHRRLDAAYETSRRKHLSADFLPHNIEALQTLQRLDGRHYGEDTRRILNAGGNLRTHRQEIERLQIKNEKEGGLSLEMHSDLEALRREIPRLEAEYRAQRMSYAENESEQVEVDRILKDILRIRYNSPDRAKLEAELSAKLRLFPPLIRRNEARARSLIDLSLNLIIEGLRNGTSSAWTLYSSLEKETRHSPLLVQRAFRTALAGDQERLTQQGRDGFGNAINAWRTAWHSREELPELFHKYFEQNPEAALNDFRSHFRQILLLAPSVNEVLNLIEISPRKDSDKSDAPVKTDRSRETNYPIFRFSPSFAERLFADLDFRQFVNEQRINSLTESISKRTIELSAPSSGENPSGFRLKEFAEHIIHHLYNKARVERMFLREVGAGVIQEIPGTGGAIFHLATDALRRTYFQSMQPPLNITQVSAFLLASLGQSLHPSASKETRAKLRAAWRQLGEHPQAREFIWPHVYMPNIWNAHFSSGSAHEFFADCFKNFEHIYTVGYDGARTAQDVEDFNSEILEFIGWVQKHHPDRVDISMRALTLYTSNGLADDNYHQVRNGLLRRHMSAMKRRLQHLPGPARARQIIESLESDFKNWNFSNYTAASFTASFIQAGSPYASLEEEFTIRNHAILQFREKIADGYSNFGQIFDSLETLLKEHVGPAKRRSSSSRGPLSNATLAQSLALVLSYRKPTPQMDQIFEKTWSIVKNDPEARKLLGDETLVRRMFYDENRRTLAQAQLEDRLHLAQVAEQIRNGTASESMLPQGLQSVRANVQEAHAVITKQFPEPSSVKNDILNLTQKQLVTNDAETRLLDAGRMNLDNWYRSKKLALLDLPHNIQHYLSNNLDRIELIEYLNGSREALPSFAKKYEKDSNLTEMLEGARRQFFAADGVTRAYVLQPFLGTEGGILQDAAAFEELTHRILGKHAESPVFRALFESYLGALRPGERKVILGHVLGSFADKPAGSVEGNLSVRAVLEAMGPFGIKAGQFLRSSGLIGPELRRDLDHFFDNALPPTRGEIFRRLRVVFGEGLPNVEAVGQIVGAGSLNYVTVVDLTDPQTGKVKRAAVRFSRSTTEDYRDADGNLVGESLWQRVDLAGQIEHENQIWQDATAELRRNPQHNIQRVGQALEEARGHAMSTLGREGPELNLSFERSVYPDVARSYNSEVDPRTGYSVDVVPPDAALQKLVPERFSNTVSVYEYVKQTPLSEVNPASLRQALARQIIDAEMRALLVNGIYDVDGHRGNWLVDIENRRLRRIDYSQRRIISAERRQTIRDTLTLMLSPRFERPQIQELARMFHGVFHFEDTIPNLEQELGSVIERRDFPSFVSPHERLLHILEKMEARLTHTRGRLTVLRIDPELLGAINSISRVMVFREQAGEQAAVESLFSHLGLNPLEYGPAFARHKFRENIARMTAFLRQRWTASKETFLRILARSRKSARQLARKPSDFSVRIAGQSRDGGNANPPDTSKNNTVGSTLRDERAAGSVGECIVNSLGSGL